MKKLILLLPLLLMAGCLFTRVSSSRSNAKEYNEDSIKTVQKKAASDLKCEEKNIKITVLKKAGTMYKELEADGCDKKIIYINNFGWKLKDK